MEDFARRKMREKVSASRAVGDVAAREHESDRSTQRVGQRVIFVVRPPRERPMA
jgi:hypothetical protein